MSWTAPTTSDLAERLTGPELTALANAAKKDGQSDPTPGILARAIDECRGYLAARPGGAMGSAGTLPIQVHGACLDLARFRLCSRLAVGRVGETLLTPSRELEYNDAKALLRDVQAGRCLVEEPDTLTTEALPGAVTPSITARPTSRMTLY
jgi:phage gp36-like protein